MADPTDPILVVNSGSSSLKFALYRMRGSEALTLSGQVERIGLGEGIFRCAGSDGRALIDQRPTVPDHRAALELLFASLPEHLPAGRLRAVGHRVVHGGRHHTQPQIVTPDLLADLHRLVPLAPNHMPSAIEAIEAVGRSSPSLPQVVCFDTAFHRDMPELAQRYALPRHLHDEGVLRYGFHGLSYEYVLHELRQTAEAEADGRVIVAHLGNGASMAAVRGGRCLDTTMGFTPAGGLVMGTRTGDLDPGVLVYLLREKGFTPDSLDELVNRQSGLAGVSGGSSDMRDLLGREASDPSAAEAVALFCYRARQFLAALAAVLGGIDTLVFTGGVGENAPAIRARIGGGLDFMGVRFDPARNAANATIVSPDGAAVAVRVMRTNEELMIARHTHRLIH